MLRLYGQALFASKKSTLEAISSQVRELYLTRSHATRAFAAHSFGNSLRLTNVELFTILHVLLKRGDEPLTMWRVIAFSVGLPVTATVLEAGSPMQPRAIFDFLLNICPWQKPLLAFFHELGLPPSADYPATVITGALFQVLSIELSHGQAVEPIAIAFKTALISLFLHGGARLIRTQLSGLARWIPDDVWAFAISSIFDAIVQRFVRFGLVSTLTWLAERTAKTVMRFTMPPLVDLPLNVTVPSSMECLICHELLRNPVVVLGHFFCEHCLNTWLDSNTTHPYTGEAISREMIEQSILMSQVVYKWQRIALAELAPDNPEE
jgi:hypothetical protein